MKKKQGITNKLSFLNGEREGRRNLKTLQFSFLHPPENPCLACIFPEVISQKLVPVRGATPGVIGSLEAVEALKYLEGIKVSLKGKLLIWEGALMNFKIIGIKKDPNCPVCGENKYL